MSKESRRKKSEEKKKTQVSDIIHFLGDNKGWHSLKEVARATGLSCQGVIDRVHDERRWPVNAIIISGHRGYKYIYKPHMTSDDVDDLMNYASMFIQKSNSYKKSAEHAINALVEFGVDVDELASMDRESLFDDDDPRHFMG